VFLLTAAAFFACPVHLWVDNWQPLHYNKIDKFFPDNYYTVKALLKEGVIMTVPIPLTRILFLALAWAAGTLLFRRLRAIDQEDEPDLSAADRPVSVIIPARNEAHNIPGVLSSLQQQSFSPLEVLLVDDNSSDGTGPLAGHFQAGVIHLDREPPPGWLGKPWACWQGYRQARGELLLFLDADVCLAPGALEKLVQVREKRGGLLSVQPHHRMERVYEQVSLVFNLVSVAAMRAFSAWGPRVRPLGAFGPCILCLKEDYERAGTHAAVKGRVLEDIALGRAFQEAGLPVQLFLGGDLLSFRMYPRGWSSLVEGWSKNFALGAQSLDPVTLLLLTAWVTGALASGMDFFRSGGQGLPAALYLLYSLQIYLVSRKLGNFSVLAAALYPLFFLAFTVLFFLSLVRTVLFRSVTWRGRSIDLDGE
jgi:4,4'-diaponeurosporenoate glycosyltransferase